MRNQQLEWKSYSYIRFRTSAYKWRSGGANIFLPSIVSGEILSSYYCEGLGNFWCTPTVGCLRPNSGVKEPRKAKKKTTKKRGRQQRSRLEKKAAKTKGGGTHPPTVTAVSSSGVVAHLRKVLLCVWFFLLPPPAAAAASTFLLARRLIPIKPNRAPEATCNLCVRDLRIQHL